MPATSLSGQNCEIVHHSFTLKCGMIENYTNGGKVRESPTYDFLIIFNAILRKMTCRIQISN